MAKRLTLGIIYYFSQGVPARKPDVGAAQASIPSPRSAGIQRSQAPGVWRHIPTYQLHLWSSPCHRLDFHAPGMAIC